MLEFNTFSIVARCARTEEFGVAVATAVPAVGAICPYLVAGVGAASTQSWVNPYLAIDTLRAMAAGAPAADALACELQDDADAAMRQVGVIGRDGPGVAWTGEACTAWQGHLVGDDFAIQGNMLTGGETLDAMRVAFLRDPSASLDERLMCALEADDRIGGDFRGKQSATIQVVGDDEYRKVDLRVDEHTAPVTELRRVLEIARQQLFPFVAGMPKRAGTSLALSDDVTAMLLKSPSKRAG